PKPRARRWRARTEVARCEPPALLGLSCRHLVGLGIGEVYSRVLGANHGESDSKGPSFVEARPLLVTVDFRVLSLGPLPHGQALNLSSAEVVLNAHGLALDVFDRRLCRTLWLVEEQRLSLGREKGALIGEASIQVRDPPTSVFLSSRQAVHRGP